MIPGSQYAFGILVVAVFFGISLCVGVQVGRNFEIRHKGEVVNPAMCLVTWLVVMLGLMYALSPVYISLIQWAASAVKGG